MNKYVIIIGHQPQADKTVYLYHTGIVECGGFKYTGRHKKRYKIIYERILSHRFIKPHNGIVDVSHCRHWDATNIWYDYVVVKWIKTVSARRIEQFAIESEIYLLREEIRHEFVKAVECKWRRTIKNMDPLDPCWPKEAWQIL